MIDGGTEPPKRRCNRANCESAGAFNAMEMLIEPKKGFDKGLLGSADLVKLTCQLVRDAASLTLMIHPSVLKARLAVPYV